MDNSLARITQATTLLEKAKTLEEVIEVHDQASAIEAYARAKGADKAHSLALEVKLRAERKGGKFLSETDGHGMHGGDRKSKDIVSLEKLGVRPEESKRWQRIAKIPDQDFESYLVTATKATQANLLAIAGSRFPGPISSKSESKLKTVKGGKLAMVELFSGSGVMSSRFRRGGWIADEVEILNGKDVMTWQPEREYQFLWAGPECYEYSMASHKPMDLIWNADRKFWLRTLDLIQAIRPRFWIIENVKLAQWLWGRAPFHFGPFFLWGYYPPIRGSIPWTYSVKGIHKDRETGARWEEDKDSAERAKYPLALCDAVFETIDKATRAKSVFEAVETEP